MKTRNLLIFGTCLVVIFFSVLAGQQIAKGKVIAIKLTKGQVKAIHAAMGKVAPVILTAAQKGILQKKYPTHSIRMAEPTFASISMSNKQLVNGNQVEMTLVKAQVEVSATGPGDKISPYLFNPQPEPPRSKALKSGSVKLTLTAKQVAAVQAGRGNQVNIQFTGKQKAFLFQSVPVSRLSSSGKRKGVVAVSVKASQIGKGNILGLRCGKGMLHALVGKALKQKLSIK